MSGGYIGVDVFFVLSGYLITGLLVAELGDRGTLDLPRFYARRAQRLLPAVLAMTIGVLGFSYLFQSPVTQSDIALMALATSVYGSNLQFALSATDYLASAADTNPLLHTWSLGVEEQFYLAWPVLLALVARRDGAKDRDSVAGGVSRLAALRVTAATVLLASFTLSILLMLSGRTHWAFFGSPARAWQFAAGALVCLIGRPAPDLPGRWSIVRWLAVIGSLLVVGSAHFLDTTTEYPGLAALVPTLGTAMVLHGGAMAPGGMAGVVLGSPLLRWFGRVSYSWYLWHWPILVFAREFSGSFSLATRLAWLAVSLAAAVLSYHTVEQPIRTNARIRASTQRGLVMLGALTVIGLVVSWGFWRAALMNLGRPDQKRYVAIAEELPSLFTRGCLVGFETVEATSCEDGPSDGAPRVVLFGDSHAAQWGPALERLGDEAGWSVTAMTKVSCPLPEVRVFNRQLGRDYVECDTWRDAAHERIRALAPDIVIASTFVGYRLTDTEWEQGSRVAIQALRRHAPVVLVLDDTPLPGFDVPSCLSRVRWQATVWAPTLGRRSCDFLDPGAGSRDALAAMRRGTAGIPGVRHVSVHGVLCPKSVCAAESNGMVVYSDDTHLSNAFAASLSPLLRQVVEEALSTASPPE